MQLQTTIKIQEQSPKIEYTSKVLLLGSCFAENIGEKFKYFKFQQKTNPFGIIFHPFVLNRLIKKSLECKSYSEADIFEHNGQWHCFDAHSILSNCSKDDFIDMLNTSSRNLNEVLTSATHILITLGTSWGYVKVNTDEMVSNCHKLPQKNFMKKLASVDEVTKSLKAISTEIKKQNPSAKIIFTVSPVRHLKDGFVENLQSKSHLISAVHQTITETENTTYFPSYEIMMDELRDYRFYNEDMLHPNKIAINYIWERFIKTWVSNDAIHTSKKVEEIQRGLDHRPFNPDSEEHQKFQDNLKNKIEVLQKGFPAIGF